jgi:hypothetical protein
MVGLGSARKKKKVNGFGAGNAGMPVSVEDLQLLMITVAETGVGGEA